MRRRLDVLLMLGRSTYGPFTTGMANDVRGWATEHRAAGERGMIDELVQWTISLDRSFAFLLALPFMVALAGLVAELARLRRMRLPPRNGQAK